jgi:putative membrane protein
MLVWLSVFLAVLIWSAIRPHDYFTWILEVFPALIGLVILAATYRTFPLTALAYGLILAHCIILMVGGHYTYAEVPLFDWLEGALQSGRNNYDKLGHFAQGFVPAIIAREILIRNSVINGRAWLNILVVSVCTAFSALYELFEWWVALLTGESAEGFLGTQGYVWDTQSDIALALLGAISALTFLARQHDRQLRAFLVRGCGKEASD